MTMGRAASNDPNTQASTIRAPTAPTTSSLVTVEFPPDVVLPASSARRLVPFTVSVGAAVLAAVVSTSI